MSPRPSPAAAAPGAATPGAAVDRLVQVVAALREHCAWTAALTHESLLAYLIEEAYELTEVVEDGAGAPDAGELKGELADILYQVLLHARLQEEAGTFALADVAEHLRAKLIRRNSHVFRPDGTLRESFPESIAEIERSYAAAKSAERGVPAADAALADTRASVFGTLPAAMPALALAAKTLERAGLAGLDDGFGAAGTAALATGTGAAGPAIAGTATGTAGAAGVPVGRTPQTEAELGELLFAVVRSARAHGLDAERALRTAVRQFHTGDG
ncbi:MazG nucleotide pyrophosphohydrolase domain-containing protein [Pseudarthrobacter sp. P1]|uniref:MazG nucleotide pyrophosphohydrolase domain-containing protein n=1 Tax=Pseudarthrobacter sp. P1 TaxID=3418418 RepID=UPI003CEA6564